MEKLSNEQMSKTQGGSLLFIFGLLLGAVVGFILAEQVKATEHNSVIL